MGNKQTAVDWLIEKIWTTDWVNYTRDEKLEVFSQAKTMHKEQIKDAYNVGTQEKGWITCNYDLKYYEETYGK